MATERELISVLLEAKPGFGLERERDGSLWRGHPIFGNESPCVDRPELVLEDERSPQGIHDRTRTARDALRATDPERERVRRETTRALDRVSGALEARRNVGTRRRDRPPFPTPVK
jgi:hypothetical protein